MTGTEIAFRLGPDSLDEARAVAGRLAALAPAAVEHVLFCDAAAGDYGCLAVWDDAADAADYIGSARVGAELAALGRRIGQPVRVRRYEMEYQRERIAPRRP